MFKSPYYLKTFTIYVRHWSLFCILFQDRHHHQTTHPKATFAYSFEKNTYPQVYLL